MINLVVIAAEDVTTLREALVLAALATTSRPAARKYRALNKELERESTEHTRTLFAEVWHLQDVCIEGVSLTLSQKRKVLERAFDSHDCAEGINWYTIQGAYNSLLAEGAI